MVKGDGRLPGCPHSAGASTESERCLDKDCRTRPASALESLAEMKQFTFLLPSARDGFSQCSHRIRPLLGLPRNLSHYSLHEEKVEERKLHYSHCREKERKRRRCRACRIKSQPVESQPIAEISAQSFSLQKLWLLLSALGPHD